MNINLLFMLLKAFILIANISQENLMYNKKGMDRLLLITVLIALGKPLYILPASVITIRTINEKHKRKKVIKEIKCTTDNTRHKHLQSLITYHNLDMNRLIDILKKHSLKKSEINSSIIILGSCIFGLLFSPIVAMILVLVSYLLTAIIKSFLNVSLSKTYVHTLLIDNIELELRTGNDKYINNIIKKYNS